MNSGIYSPSHPEFWKEFYEDGIGKSSYEWYLNPSEISEWFVKVLTKNQNILQLGCGCSYLAEEIQAHSLCPDGIKIVSIDINEGVIDRMKNFRINLLETKKKERKKIKSKTSDKKKKKLENRERAIQEEKELNQSTYLTMDATNLTFPDNNFDIIIEKGTVDALLSNAQTETGENIEVKKLLKEVYRVLKPGGKYMFISGNDSFVTYPYLCELEWKIDINSHQKIRQGDKAVIGTYFLYTVISDKSEIITTPIN